MMETATSDFAGTFRQKLQLVLVLAERAVYDWGA
jgi:hypothetical protein